MPAVDLSDAQIEWLAERCDEANATDLARQLRAQSFAARGLKVVDPQHATWLYQPPSK